MGDKGVNFRGTAGYATDGTDTTNCLGYSSDGYPQVDGSITHGWETSGATGSDRSSGVDNRLRGQNNFSNNTTARYYRINLDSTGDHTVHGAWGDATTSREDIYFELQDDSTTFKTLDDGGNITTGGSFWDANGTKHTSAANWVSSEAGVARTFTSTIFRCRVTHPTETGTYGVIAHLFIVDDTGGGAQNGDANLASVTVTGKSPSGAPSGAASATAQVASTTVNGEQAAAAGSGEAATTAALASITVTALSPTGLGSGAVGDTANLASVTVTAAQPLGESGSQTVEASLAQVTVSGASPASAGTGEASVATSLAQVTVSGGEAGGAGSGEAAATANLASVTVTALQALTGVSSIDVYLETVCYVTTTLSMDANVTQNLSVDAKL